MKKTRYKRNLEGRNQNPDAIITSDLHLRDSSPINRIDDYIEAQKTKLIELRNLQQKYQCPVICAGDVFDKAIPSPWLIGFAYEYLPKWFYTVIGNHDLPHKSEAMEMKSGLYLLEKIGRINVMRPGQMYQINVNNIDLRISGVGYTDKLDPDRFPKKDPGMKSILVMHKMTWKGAADFPDAYGYESQSLLRQLHTKFDLIVSGDNHNQFSDKYRKSIIINPGTMMRNSIDKIDFNPKFCLYYSTTNDIAWVPFTINKNVFDEKMIEDRKERDVRVKAYIEHLKSDGQIELDFLKKLEKAMEINECSDKMKEVIWEAAR